MKSFARPALAAIALFVATVAHAGSPADAQKFVDNVASQVLGVLKTKDSTATKLSKMEDIFSTAIDIPYVGKYVLARHWRSATPEQQQAYLAAFEPAVIKNYAGKLTKYSGQNYKLKNAREASGDGYVVTMEIVDPGNPSVFVDYTLREAGGSYKIIDIAVEGISLRGTLRSEYNAYASRNGIDGLTKALQKQAARK